jgi:hypothetical protein
MLPAFTNNKADLQTAIDTAPTTIGRNDETRLTTPSGFPSKQPQRGRKQSRCRAYRRRGREIQRPTAASIYTLDEVITHAAVNGVAIYPIGIGSNIDTAVMTAWRTKRGKYFQIASAAELSGVYQAIREILAGQYSIKYVSSLTGSIPITLNIDVAVGGEEGTVVGQFVGCP